MIILIAHVYARTNFTPYVEVILPMDFSRLGTRFDLSC